jgi:hypothetical protein
MVGAFMVGSPDLAVSMLMTIELISYLPLIDLDLSEHETNLLVGSNQLDSLPDFIPGIHCSSAQARSSSYNFKCSSLFKNAQKEILILILALLIQLTERCMKKDDLAESEARLKSLRSIKVKLMLIVSFGLFIKSSVHVLNYADSSVQAVLGWPIALAVLSLYLGWAVLNLLNKAGCVDYPDLKPNRASQVMYGLIILHRVIYAGTLVLLDTPKVQLGILTVITFAVSPRQLLCYFVLVRPFTDFNTNMKQGILFFSATVFNLVLLLKAFSLISSSSDAVSTGFIAVIYTLIGVSLLALVIATWQKVKAILNSGEDPYLFSL